MHKSVRLVALMEMSLLDAAPDSQGPWSLPGRDLRPWWPALTLSGAFVAARPGRLPLGQAGGVGGGLGAPLHPQLHEHVRHVVLHRLLGQEHLLADLAVGEALGDETEDAP